MRALVTWGSKMGGTAGIARLVAEELERAGVEVDLTPADEVRELDTYDAAIIGGAIYGNRWHKDARRFVAHNAGRLRCIPTWLFSSGPLDDSATERDIPPTHQVRALMERIGALGHATFGGRLRPDASGFPAAVMARKYAGDWRDPEQIRGWARARARELPAAMPGAVVNRPARSITRLVAHGVAGWAACGAIMGGLLAVTTTGAAIAVHAIAAPLIFIALSRHYFAPIGARQPLPVAAAFTGIVVGLDLAVVAGAIQGSLEMFASITGTWLPFALIFLATWMTGAVMSTLPWETRGQAAGAHP